MHTQPLVHRTKHLFPSLLRTSSLLPILPDSTKWAYDFDWHAQQTLCPPPPSSPPASCFNPLTVPLSLLLRFLFCSEWGSKAAVSASFPSLIALLAGGGTRSFSDTDGEGGGLSRGEKKNGWLVFVVVSFPLPPLLGLVCVDTDTLGWHLHTPDTDACQSYIRRLAGKE